MRCWNCYIRVSKLFSVHYVVFLQKFRKHLAVLQTVQPVSVTLSVRFDLRYLVYAMVVHSVEIFKLI